MAAHQAPLSLDSLGKNTGVGCHFLLQYMKVKSQSEVAQPCPTLCNPVGCSPPGCSVHWILQQEYWSGLPVPISGELPNSGIDPATHWPTRLCFSLPQQTHRTLEPVCSLIPGAGAPTVAEKVSALLTGAPGQPAAPSSGLRSHLCTSGWTIGGFRE